MPKATAGTQLMNEIFAGMHKRTAPQTVLQVKTAVSAACEELIEYGARIRPLLIDDKPAGWVRGLHLTERKALRLWFPNSLDFVENAVLMSTSLTREQVNSLTSQDIYGLAKLIKDMGDYDLSLLPYMTAFSTTSVSENLWNSSGPALTNYHNKTITLPDDKTIKILAASDQAKLWATLCIYREHAKERLDGTLNATMIARTMAAKGSLDNFVAQLKTALSQLQPDAVEPWENIVDTTRSINVDDGWAHPDDTVQGMLRELTGLIEGDRHERVMTAFYDQQIAKAEDEKKRLASLIQKRGGPGIGQQEGITIRTEKEVRERQAQLRRGFVPVQTEFQEGSGTDVPDRLKKYDTKKPQPV